MGRRAGGLVSPGLTLLVWLTAHCPRPQGESDASRADLWASANTSILQGFWCQPASQLPRDQLSALIRRVDPQQAPLKAWQLSCLANLATWHGLQDDFALHPPDLLLFYNLTQVRKADRRAFTRRAAQGHTELLANLPDQRAALQRMALACLGGPHPRLSASDLMFLGVLVCDLDASHLVAADPCVLQSLQRCPRLTTTQQAALNTLLASGRTTLGPPGSWNVEGLQALGPLATYISPGLWVQVREAKPEAGSQVAAQAGRKPWKEGRQGDRVAKGPAGCIRLRCGPWAQTQGPQPTHPTPWLRLQGLMGLAVWTPGIRSTGRLVYFPWMQQLLGPRAACLGRRQLHAGLVCTRPGLPGAVAWV
nr:mesothelin-like protein [Manis javanica]